MKTFETSNKKFKYVNKHYVTIEGNTYHFYVYYDEKKDKKIYIPGVNSILKILRKDKLEGWKVNTIIQSIKNNLKNQLNENNTLNFDAISKFFEKENYEKEMNNISSTNIIIGKFVHYFIENFFKNNLMFKTYDDFIKEYDNKLVLDFISELQKEKDININDCQIIDQNLITMFQKDKIKIKIFNSIKGFYSWYNEVVNEVGNKIDKVYNELKLYNIIPTSSLGCFYETFYKDYIDYIGYAGTIDFIFVFKDLKEKNKKNIYIIDFKTSSHIVLEYLLQISAYYNMLMENIEELNLQTTDYNIKLQIIQFDKSNSSYTKTNIEQKDANYYYNYFLSTLNLFYIKNYNFIKEIDKSIETPILTSN